jgi:hypothetical protein
MDVASGFPVSEGSKQIGRKCAEGHGPFYDVTFVSVSQILTLAASRQFGIVKFYVKCRRGQC